MELRNATTAVELLTAIWFVFCSIIHLIQTFIVCITAVFLSLRLNCFTVFVNCQVSSNKLTYLLN